MIRLIQQVYLVRIYSEKRKRNRICFTVALAYKTFFNSYCVIVDRPGEDIFKRAVVGGHLQSQVSSVCQSIVL